MRPREREKMETGVRPTKVKKVTRSRQTLSRNGARKIPQETALKLCRKK